MPHKGIEKLRERGFTLVELLVVVLVIGVLAAIAMPMYQKTVERSKVTSALSVLGTIATAEQSYFLVNGEYTQQYSHLDRDFIDKNGLTPTEGSYSISDFTVVLEGTSQTEGLAIAHRIGKEYVLAKYYDSGKLCCYHSEDDSFCTNIGISSCDFLGSAITGNYDNDDEVYGGGSSGGGSSGGEGGSGGSGDEGVSGGDNVGDPEGLLSGYDGTGAYPDRPSGWNLLDWILYILNYLYHLIHG